MMMPLGFGQGVHPAVRPGMGLVPGMPFGPGAQLRIDFKLYATR